jgi:alpha-tubulin suppressor-like RCC1 family protein
MGFPWRSTPQKKKNQDMNLTPSHSCLSAHIILYTQTGELWGWGENQWAAVGTGDNAPCPQPRRVKLDEEIVSFASGWSHNLAITKDGRLFVWGNNRRAQLGNGWASGDQNIPGPLPMPNSLPVTHVTCGQESSYAVTSDGSLFAWGNNNAGQTGVCRVEGELVLTPTLVPLPAKVVKILAGRHHVLAWTEDGEVYSWGSNAHCQSHFPASSDPQKTPKINSEISKFSEFFVGGDHNLAVDSEGTLWGWGRNFSKQLGKKNVRSGEIVKINLEHVELVATGLNHSLVLTKNGDVHGWGEANSGQLGVCEKSFKTPKKKIEFSENSPFVFILCGEGYSAVMTLDGSIYLLGGPVFRGQSLSEQIPKRFTEMKFQIPMSFLSKKLWNEIMFWVFLGYFDENSVFYRVPKEICFNFIHVFVTYKPTLPSK